MMKEAACREWLKLQDILARDMTRVAGRHWQEFVALRRVLRPYTGEIRGKRVLDIGCGRLYPFSLLFHNLGNAVTGIDIVYSGIAEPLFRRYWKILRWNGLENFAGNLMYEVLAHNRTYYRALRDACDFPLSMRDIDIRQMSVESMLLPDETFDVVISIAVFEHLHDVSQALSEMQRVMKAGGIAYISIHLFTSPSGGHHYKWENTDMVPPWDHIRQRKLPLTTCLNGLREQDYLSLFQDKFKILEVVDIDQEEGKPLLTPEIRAELGDYSEEELLKHGIAIVAVKK